MRDLHLGVVRYQTNIKFLYLVLRFNKSFFFTLLSLDTNAFCFHDYITCLC